MPAALEPVSQLRKRQLLALRGKTWWRIAIVLVPIAVGALATAVIPTDAPVGVFVAAALITALAGLVGTYFLADYRARAAFLDAWARTRGWTAGAGPWLDEATPLLRDGDRRESGNHIHGPLAGGGEAALCHFTYEVRHETSSSNGTTTSWESHEFTVVESPVAAPDIPSLSLHPRSFGDNRVFDSIDSALTSDRVVQTRPRTRCSSRSRTGRSWSRSPITVSTPPSSTISWRRRRPWPPGWPRPTQRPRR